MSTKNQPCFMLGMTGLAENVVFLIVFSIAAGIAADLGRTYTSYGFVAGAIFMAACAFLRYLDGDRLVG